MSTEISENLENLNITESNDIEEVKKMYPKAEFKWGEYKYDIEDRVNELMLLCKKEFPTINNYLLHTQVVDYILHEELKLERDNEAWRERYEANVKESQKLLYENVELINE